MRTTWRRGKSCNIASKPSTDWARRLVATGSALHAYVLMTHHVHLLLTPTEVEAVPHLIISLGRRYVQYVNPQQTSKTRTSKTRVRPCLLQTDKGSDKPDKGQALPFAPRLHMAVIARRE